MIYHGLTSFHFGDFPILVMEAEIYRHFKVFFEFFEFGLDVEFCLGAFLLDIFLNGFKSLIDFLNDLILYLLVLSSHLGHLLLACLLN